MIVENIEPLRRALRAHSLATARMEAFLKGYAARGCSECTTCDVCPEQPARFAEFAALKDALANAWSVVVAVFQADEPIDSEA